MGILCELCRGCMGLTDYCHLRVRTHVRVGHNG